MDVDTTGPSKAALCLISGAEEDQLFLGEVSSAIQWPIRVYADASRAAASIDPAEETFFFVDVSSIDLLEAFEKSFSGMLSDSPGCIPAERVHFIGPESWGDMSLHKSLAGRFSHFIPRKFGNVKDAGRHYARVLRRLHSPSSPEFGPARSMSLCHSTDKAKVLSEIEKFIRDCPILVERCVQFMLNAVDELIMNAVYDAPITDAGEQLLKHVPRDAPVEIPLSRPVQLHLSMDGEYAAFTVIDGFGSVNREKLLDHLLGERAQALMIESSGAGAGIGLAATFRRGGSLLFRYDPGRWTEVTVAFRLAESYREFKDQFRFVSVCRIRDP